ncbi:MAG: hypothetical protein FWD85_00100 [Microbacteriaceae bacterium]|nr:hypothetical protein [Microbacteriaceae bacterium]MCL2793684.1 hypothetical protein [Microbacteriaceae bacterium]
MSALGHPTWFRSGGRAIEGWVHRPDDGRAVGAVVIAPSLAQESQVSYRALRVLAITAARRGWVAVRFAWSGQGDSEPAQAGLDLVEAWRQDLRAAVRLAEHAAGRTGVDVVGFRVGAAVAATTAAPGIRSRVLWEPIGGRAFLRRHEALRKVALPDGFPLSADGVEVSSYRFAAADAAAIRGLGDPTASGPGELPDGTRIVFEDDPETAARLYGTEQLLARAPLGSIDRLLGALVPAEPVALPAWAPEAEAVVVDRESGLSVRQRFVAIGADRLPGIYTAPVDAERRPAAALLVPAGGEAKGVNRVWAPASRRLGAHGVANLRADPRGFGDAAEVADIRDPNLLSESVAADAGAMAAWLHTESGAPVTGVGVCAGAWVIARAATRVPLRRIVMINNQAWRCSSEYYRDIFERRQDAPLGGGATRASVDGSLEPAQGPGPLRAFKDAVRARSPYPLRRVLARFGVLETVEQVLRPVPRTTSVRLLFGPEDQPWFSAMDGEIGFERLRAGGRRMSLDLDARTDHALLSHSAYETVMHVLDEEFCR